MAFVFYFIKRWKETCFLWLLFQLLYEPLISVWAPKLFAIFLAAWDLNEPLGLPMKELQGLGLIDCGLSTNQGIILLFLLLLMLSNLLNFLMFEHSSNVITFSWKLLFCISKSSILLSNQKEKKKEKKREKTSHSPIITKQSFVSHIMLQTYTLAHKIKYFSFSKICFLSWFYPDKILSRL